MKSPLKREDLDELIEAIEDSLETKDPSHPIYEELTEELERLRGLTAADEEESD